MVTSSWTDRLAANGLHTPSGIWIRVTGAPLLPQSAFARRGARRPAARGYWAPARPLAAPLLKKIRCSALQRREHPGCSALQQWEPALQCSTGNGIAADALQRGEPHLASSVNLTLEKLGGTLAGAHFFFRGKLAAAPCGRIPQQFCTRVGPRAPTNNRLLSEMSPLGDLLDESRVRCGRQCSFVTRLQRREALRL